MAFAGDGSTTGIGVNISNGIFPVASGLNGATALTMAARIWITGIGTGFPRIATVGDTSYGLLLPFTTSDIRFVDPSGTSDSAVGVVSTNAWYDVVAVYDSGVQKTVWVNGKKTALTTRSGSLTTTSQMFTIGNRPTGTGGDAPWAGFLADVGLWSYAWPDELCYDWNNPRTKYDLYWQPNTRAYSFMSAIAAGTAGYLLVKN
jgi:hypothetical protein